MPNESSPLLRVGDTVSWSGAWATNAPQEAVVTNIMIDCDPLCDGDPVEEVAWETVRHGRTVVDLENGYWAYGYQLEPIAKESEAAA